MTQTSNPTRREDAPEEFQGCARPCWQNLDHTYSYGNCAYAELVDTEDATVAVLGPVKAGADGRPQVEITDVPLMALLPWVRHLPLQERYDFLDEVAASEEPAITVLTWKRTAETWADPDVLEALTRPMKLEDYGEVTEPVCPCGSPCGGHGEAEESSMSPDAADATAAQAILTERKNRGNNAAADATPGNQVPGGEPAGPHPDPAGAGVGHDPLD